jgi:hypothetical protein
LSKDHARRRAAESNQCSHCGGKFGLIRHTHGRKQFCSRPCRESFWAVLRERARALVALRPGRPAGKEIAPAE